MCDSDIIINMTDLRQPFARAAGDVVWSLAAKSRLPSQTAVQHWCLFGGKYLEGCFVRLNGELCVLLLWRVWRVAILPNSRSAKWVLICLYPINHRIKYIYLAFSPFAVGCSSIKWASNLQLKRSYKRCPFKPHRNTYMARIFLEKCYTRRKLFVAVASSCSLVLWRILPLLHLLSTGFSFSHFIVIKFMCVCFSFFRVCFVFIFLSFSSVALFCWNHFRPGTTCI